ncbi:MAG TPA: SDR family NAD(P)-dependent oxidoreductase, partial [Opitutaceae bacterium]|nr:SDR family NAD(P)-dependent oxidoreductase [Opitutaceae bacterium]
EGDFSVEVYPIAKNLEKDEAPGEIYEELKQQSIAIHTLVNNAGLGQRGKFWEIPLEKDLTMIRVNLEAPVRLTKLFLPPMITRGRGRILNTAAIAGFEPGPLMAIYHATKAFLLSFSESLATELEGTKISVTALCPGPVDTDFFPKADMVGTRVFQEGRVMAPQEVAKTAYDACVRGERYVVPGVANKAMVFSRRLMTELAQAKTSERMYEAVKTRKREPGDIARKANA